MWWGIKRILSSRFRDIHFIWIQSYRIFCFSRRVFAKHHTVSSWCRIFTGKSQDRSKFWFYRFQSFSFFAVIVIPILLKTAFWQTSIHSQSLVNHEKFPYEAVWISSKCKGWIQGKLSEIRGERMSVKRGETVWSKLSQIIIELSFTLKVLFISIKSPQYNFKNHAFSCLPLFLSFLTMFRRLNWNQEVNKLNFF